METQAISAPVDRLTREAPKRQVGYGLPCAKCHKYFPADLEACPICKGRERVSPIIAPKIPKPVQSETSAAPSSTNHAVKQEVKESPKSPTLVPPIEIKVKDQPLDHKESTTIPLVAQVPAAVEPAPASLASTQTENEAPKSEFPAFAPVEVHTVESRTVEVRAENQPLDHKESTTIPVVAEIPAAAEPARTSGASTQAAAPPTEAKVKDQPLDHMESITVLVAAELPPAVEPARAGLVLTQKAKEPPKSESPAVTCLNDQPIQEEPISTPAFVEVRTSDPVPTAIVARSKEEERTTELETPAATLPMQLDTEEQRRDKINQALRIVIPMLVETQAFEPVPVPAEQKLIEQEKRVEVPEISETPTPAIEVKVVEAKIAEAKVVVVKPVASPAVFNSPNHHPIEGKSKAIDKGSDAPPKPAHVSAPVVVHVNLGELGASKSTPERAPAAIQFKEVKSTEPETSSSDISSDADALESPAPVGGRKLDLVTFALGVVVLACAVLLITLAAFRLMPRHVSEPVRRAKAAYSAPPTADQNTNPSIPMPLPTAAAPVNSASSNSSPVVAPTAAPAQPLAAPATNPSSSANSQRVLTLAPGLAEGNLLYRVEPDYPEEARRQGVQGPVVLDLHISKDGLVQGVDLVSGQPLLVQAATAAVKQWRFRTRYINGNEVEMQARITLHFALPTQ